MRKLTVGLIGAAVAASAANAADLPRGHLAPAPYSAFSWAGPHVGLNAGLLWGTVDNSSADPLGFLGGIQIGYDWQLGQFVYGVETDLQVTNADDTFAAFKFSNPWFGTLRGRLGFGMNNILLYATAGLAYGSGEVQTAGLSERHSHFGWTIGMGAEVGLAPNWSARVEYLFVSLGSERYALTGLDHDFESSLLRLGVNFRF